MTIPLGSAHDRRSPSAIPCGFQRRRCSTRQATFLAAYRKTSSIAAAAKAVGIKPAQHYRWLAASPAYWEAFRELQEDVTRRLQDKVVELAMEGWAERVYYRGRVCGTIGQPIPRALPQFIEKEQHHLGHLSYGTVSFSRPLPSSRHFGSGSAEIRNRMREQGSRTIRAVPD